MHAEEPFVAGDKITLERQPGGWKISMQVHKGGIIAPAYGPIYGTPEQAIEALRSQTASLDRASA